MSRNVSLAQQQLLKTGDSKVESLARQLPFISTMTDSIIMLRDGDLMASFALEGVSAATSDQNTLDDLSLIMSNLISQQQGDVGFYINRISTKTQPSLDPVDQQFPFAAEIDSRWGDYIGNIGLRQRTTLFTILLRPSKVTGLFRKMSGGGKQARAEDLQKRVHRLNNIANAFADSVAEAMPVRLTVSGGRWLGLLRATMTGEYSPLVQGRKFKPLNDLIATTPVSFSGDQFTVFGPCSKTTKYGAIFTLKDYPGATEPGILDPLDLSVDMTVTNSFSPVDDVTAQEEIRLVIRRMNVADDAAISLQEELVEALDDVASGRGCLGKHHCTIALYADSPDILDDQIATVTRVISAAGGSVIREAFGARAAYFAQVPGNFAYRSRASSISSINFAHLGSLHGATRGNPKSLSPWGEAITILPTANGEPFRLNVHLPGKFNDRTVGHTLVLGMTGSGKTLGTAFLLAQAMRINPRIIVFDKDQGMEMPIRALGGSYSAVKVGQSTGFNPFSLEVDERGQAWLTDWLEALLSPVDRALSPIQLKTLAKAAKANGKASGNLQNIHSFATQLRSTDDGGDLKELMSRWDKGGQFGWLFDGMGPDSLDFTNDITGFDLTEIFDNNMARTAWLSYVFRRIERTIEDERPTLLVLDEAWKLLDDPYFETRLKDWMLTMRKKNVAVILLTQRVSHITESRAGGAILESVASRILYPSSKLEPKELAPLNLTEREQEFMMLSNAGNHLALIQSGDGSSIVDFDLSSLGSLMGILGGGRGEDLSKRNRGWRDQPEFWQE